MTNVPATQEELPALAQELICGDDARAEQTALKIGLHGCEALAHLAPVLADPDPDRRWWAARALGQVEFIARIHGCDAEATTVRCGRLRRRATSRRPPSACAPPSPR